MRITILGCGGAGGVPLVGPNWGDCDPNEPRNRRRRVSILVDDPRMTDGPLLVDTSPDLREQLLDARVDRLGGVLYTHEHADHLHGIDDLRGLNRRQRTVIPVFGTERTLAAIQRRFGYAFDRPSDADGRQWFYKPSLAAHTVRAGEAFRASGLEIVPFEQDHGTMTTLGYRFGPVAYSTDAVALGDEAFAALQGIDLWIVDCLGYEPYPTHAHLEKTLAWIERVMPSRAILTHMGPELDYRRLARKLPSGVEPAYDGMTIDIELEGQKSDARIMT